MKYKDYIVLLEHDDVGNEYKSIITIDEALNIFFDKCDKNHNLDIYRGIRVNRLGDNDKTPERYGVCNIIEAQKGHRTSMNTTNHYTVILDELIKEKDINYPLRSKSIITSTQRAYAMEYGDLFRVVPYNDVVLGVVPTHDIWRVTMKGYTIKQINDFMSDVGIKATNIKDISKQIENLSDDEFDKLHGLFERGNIEKSIRELYDLDTLDFEFVNSSKYKTNNHSEVWIGGKCLLIDEKIYKIFSRLTSKNCVLVKHGGSKKYSNIGFAEVFVKPDNDLSYTDADTVIDLDNLEIAELNLNYDGDEYLPSKVIDVLNDYMPNDKKKILVDMIDDYKDDDDKFTFEVIIGAFEYEMKNYMKHFTVDGFKMKHGNDDIYIMKNGLVK